MRKAVLAGTVVTIPLVVIAVREAGRLIAGLSDPGRSSAAPILWIFGILVTLALIWIGILLSGRVEKRDPSRLGLDATAAIAIAEARKRPAAAKCPACGRPRLIQEGGRCLYCGERFAAAGPEPGSTPPV